MADTRDITWQIVESGTPIPKGPTDPCAAQCSECRGGWRCGESDQDCQTPYVLHRCPACATPKAYVPPYWLHSRVIIKDRRSQGLYGIVAVQLGLTRQDSSVEVIAANALTEASPVDARSLVVRIGIPDIEAHFEPTSQKMPLIAQV